MSESGSWRTFIEGLADDAEFSDGASEAQLAQVEQALGIPLPKDLRSLLLESNGVRADYSAEIIWTCEGIIGRNATFRETPEFRELYMPFDNLLFFGDDGCGDQFAYAISADGQIHNRDIYCWNHETDGREGFAGWLRQYFEFRLAPEA